MISRSRKRVDMYLGVALGLTIVLGLCASNIAFAQQSKPDISERCSRAELERMLREPFADCPGSFASFSKAKSIELEPKELEGETRAFGQSTQTCPFDAVGDNPHRSAGDVSAHGWWNTSVPSLCPEFANVEVWIQGLWCDPWGCLWLTVANNEREIRPRNTSGQRTTARRNCVADNLVGFRNIVRADLVGASGSDLFVGTPINVECYPG